MSNEISITQIVEKDLKGSTFICGLPGVGLVGNIVANFLINNLNIINYLNLALLMFRTILEFSPLFLVHLYVKNIN